MDTRKTLGLHVATGTAIFIFMLFIVFSSDNPSVILSSYVLIIGILVITSNEKKIGKGLFFFFPAAILIIIINMLCVSEGSIVLFTILKKRITLESVIYGLVMCLKFLAVIYIFMIFECIIDSDSAVSYFASRMPKSTLTLMLIFKLIPAIKNKFYSLKDVYTMRGVDFSEKNGKETLKSYIPIMSVLLESSMESSFDVGEAAFVRGFLSNKRSVYDRQKIKKEDWIIMSFIVIIFVGYILEMCRNFFEFPLYEGIKFSNLINPGIIFIFLGMAILTILLITFKCIGEREHGLLRD